MGKRVSRWLLGICYVVLVTLLLLNQMGVVGEARNSAVSILGTLFLGIALAVVLVLYIRVTDQMKEQRRDSMSMADSGTVLGTEEQRTAGSGNAWTVENRDAAAVKTADGQTERSLDAQGYEEIYASFLNGTQKYELSERELEVAWLLYRGYTNRQIGEELYIAETTVKKHVSHIYQKMEVCCRKDFRTKVRMGE